MRLLHEVLPELRKTKGLTQEALARRTAQPGDEGVALATIQGYEKRSGAGAVPELEILEALGRALGVNAAETFYEYPIAAARRAARPGVSQRRTRLTPSDELVEEVEAEGQRRDRQRASRGRASKRKNDSGRAA